MASTQTELPSDDQSLEETEQGTFPHKQVFRGTHVVRQTPSEIIDELLSRVTSGERIQLNNDLRDELDVTPDNHRIADIPYLVKEINEADMEVRLRRGSDRDHILSIDPDTNVITVTPPNPDQEFEVYSLRVRPISIEVHDDHVNQLRNILEAPDRHGFNADHTLALSDKLAGGQRVFTRRDARCILDAINTVRTVHRANVAPREGTFLDKYTAPRLK